VEDAPADVLVPDSGNCTDHTAVVLGNGSSTHEALATGRGAFVMASVGSALIGSPALVPTGAGFHAALRSTNDALSSTASSGTTWSALTQIGAATTSGPPALSTIGPDLHLVYLGSNGKYYHGTFSNGFWDAAGDPVGGVGASQSFGPTAVGMTTVGGVLLFAHRGGSGPQLYAEEWSSGTWTSGPVSTAQSDVVPPAVIALNGGAADAMVAFLRVTDFKVSFATRTSGTWSTPAILDTTIYSSDPVALAPMSGGRALLVFRGSDNVAYFSTYSGSAWSLPAQPVLSSKPALSGPPAAAAGACGDDAVVVLPVSGSDALVVSYTGGAWSAPSALTGATSATGAAIATNK
jgi:hypothetical protein